MRRLRKKVQGETNRTEAAAGSVVGCYSISPFEDEYTWHTLAKKRVKERREREHRHEV